MFFASCARRKVIALPESVACGSRRARAVCIFEGAVDFTAAVNYPRALAALGDSKTLLETVASFELLAGVFIAGFCSSMVGGRHAQGGVRRGGRRPGLTANLTYTVGYGGVSQSTIAAPLTTTPSLMT